MEAAAAASASLPSAAAVKATAPQITTLPYEVHHRCAGAARCCVPFCAPLNRSLLVSISIVHPDIPTHHSAAGCSSSGATGAWALTVTYDGSCSITAA
jgi:hypothetical protein